MCKSVEIRGKCLDLFHGAGKFGTVLFRIENRVDTPAGIQLLIAVKPVNQTVGAAQNTDGNLPAHPFDGAGIGGGRLFKRLVGIVYHAQCTAFGVLIFR